MFLISSQRLGGKSVLAENPGLGFLRNLLLLVTLAGLSACSSLPKSPAKPVTLGMPPLTEGLLAETSDAVLANGEPGQSAFLLINQNDEALRWRLALIDSAQHSIDLQVFIWSVDESGILLWERIAAASQRGVRVRLLLDDMPKDWSDRGTELISRQPNVDVRRFNPGRIRTGLIARALQMSTQFRTLNRRMHNKQMIVDGRWAILGGRNIGNPYFGLSQNYNNRDLDLMITGELVHELTHDFDRYWNSDAAYPGAAMATPMTARKEAAVLEKFSQTLQANRVALAKTDIPIDPIDWRDAFARLPEQMEPGNADLLIDSPIVKGDRGPRLIDQIPLLDLENKYETCSITPYMIPSRQMLKDLKKSVKEDHRVVRMLVPSMESNNHTMAHSHYGKYRKKLLDAGVELYEFRGNPSEDMRAFSNTPPVRSDFISLHTKAFILDRRWVVIGSLNLDPRSIKVNTEHMVFIDSPRLAADLLADFEILTAPENAWKVTADWQGHLRWTSDQETRTQQPARGFLQRCKSVFYRILPIEELL